MTMKNHHCRRFLFVVPFLGLAFVALFTTIVMLLWNHVLADVLPVHTVTFWQAAGILVLAKILFGGLPCSRGRGWGSWRRRCMEGRWERLPPEERERLREEMKRRFGDWPRPPWCDHEEDKGVGECKAPTSPTS
jgi:hypothetical protein